MGLLCFLLCPVRARCFASSVVTLQGYKIKRSPVRPLHPLAQTVVASSPPSMRLKREREKKRGEF
jgi:hypothetical protein